MDPLTRIKRIADYQFGRGGGDVLLPDDVEIEYS
ncbi:MAG: pseudouridine synthase, partial [Candidatus Bathyarchaeia archaeon]